MTSARTDSRQTCSPVFDRGLRSARSPTQQAFGLLAFSRGALDPARRQTRPRGRGRPGRPRAHPRAGASGRRRVHRGVRHRERQGPRRHDRGRGRHRREGSVIRDRRAPRRLGRPRRQAVHGDRQRPHPAGGTCRRRARRRLLRVGPQGRRRAQLASLAGVGLLHVRHVLRAGGDAGPGPARRAPETSGPQRGPQPPQRVGGVPAPDVHGASAPAGAGARPAVGRHGLLERLPHRRPDGAATDDRGRSHHRHGRDPEVRAALRQPGHGLGGRAALRARHAPPLARGVRRPPRRTTRRPPPAADGAGTRSRQAHRAATRRRGDRPARARHRGPRRRSPAGGECPARREVRPA